MIVETQELCLELPEGGLQLSDGGSLPEVRVAYETYGTLAADGKNAILVCHALTGDAHCAGFHGKDGEQPGWWNPVVGPGKAIDTNRYFVICSNILGGCKGSTGPASIDPRTGKPYGSSFPMVTIRDVVQVQKLLLEQLQVRELFAVVGGSMGGMQALEWAISYPEFVKRCIFIASAVSLTPQALAFDIIGRQEIESDANWHGGDYYVTDCGPTKGLSRARQLGHVTYLSSASMELKFGRELREQPRSSDRSKFSTDFQVESYLDYNGNKFVGRFDANSYMHISRMMDMFDRVKDYMEVEPLPEDFAERAAWRKRAVEWILEPCQCRFLVISITSDWLFPPSQQLEVVGALLARRKPVSFYQLDSAMGHDAFLIDYDIMCPGIEAFLNGQAEDSPPVEQQADLELIADMIPNGSHVLDVGSGDGRIMQALQRRSEITGICLDITQDKVVECLRKGLNAIQLDADGGLDLMADDAFDCVLLNQTIQQLPSALRAIKQLLRIAKTGIVGFPNFAYYHYRYEVLLGRLPVSDTLPYEWYDTPNIHLVTIGDFRELCDRNGIRIEKVAYASDSWLGRLLLAFGRVNMGAERALVRVARAN